MKKNDTDTSMQYITDALIQLMKKNSYDEISVTDIAKKAGVGRATFYRHFKSKEDVIKNYFIQQKEQFMLQTIYKSRCRKDFEEKILRVFKMLKKQSAFMQIIINSHLEYLYRDFVNSEFVENIQNEYSGQSVYAAYYAAGSFMNVSIEWVKAGCTESAEYISEIYINQLFASVP
ncbi:MAG: TetR/AcrR family transcriptional regulator [Treponema sp.]